MKISLVDSIKKNQNIVFVTDALEAISDLITKEEKTYFQQKWKTEDFQFLKKTNGYLMIYKTEKAKLDAVRKAGFTAFKEVKDEKILTIAGEDYSNVLAFLEGFYLSSYQFVKYVKDADKKKNKLELIQIKAPIKQSDINELEHLVNSVFWARNMVNEPVNHLGAEKFAQEIEKLFYKTEVKVEVLHQTKIEALKMGGLLAVNKGSDAPATFTIVEYKPAKSRNKSPIVLVGKGVVYDTGGLNIKTGNFMDGMKSDMAGAACMMGTIDALAKNKIPIYVIGLVPATDNRPGGEAFASGDIIKMYDGTTVEILNTDAEGRLILADALAYANSYKPELVIDAATLTGSAVRALGTKTSISMGNAKDKYFKNLYDAGIKTGDKVFRFPFWEEYGEEMKSDLADLKNLGSANAGMITAGKFLEHFVKYPYIHIDIAGPAFLDGVDSYNGKGGTGAGVRLLYEFIKNWE